MKAAEVMEHLARFVEDDPDDVATMTADEINALLIGEAMALEAFRSRLHARLAAIRAERLDAEDLA